MQILLRVLFLLIVIAGIALVFYVSWFWSLLAIPMVLVLGADLVERIFRKKEKK